LAVPFSSYPGASRAGLCRDDGWRFADREYNLHTAAHDARPRRGHQEIGADQEPAREESGSYSLGKSQDRDDWRILVRNQCAPGVKGGVVGTRRKLLSR